VANALVHLEQFLVLPRLLRGAMIVKKTQHIWADVHLPQPMVTTL
jgi:hypothetical protein